MSDTQSTQARKAGRTPIQERAAARMAKVLEAAELMLKELGPEKTSIPALAEAAGVPRAAIYPFFPDKYALYSHLAQLHMQKLTEALAPSQTTSAKTWQDWVDALVKTTADYYNNHPVASILLLRGTFTDADRNAHAAKNVTIGGLLRAQSVNFSALRTLPTVPDVAMIATELAFACMRYGYAEEGHVSPAICDEATRAVTAYLGAWASQDASA